MISLPTRRLFLRFFHAHAHFFTFIFPESIIINVVFFSLVLSTLCFCQQSTHTHTHKIFFETRGQQLKNRSDYILTINICQIRSREEEEEQGKKTEPHRSQPTIDSGFI